MIQEHHMNQNSMQRNPRLAMQHVGPPPNQLHQRAPMVMGMPPGDDLWSSFYWPQPTRLGVLVPMPSGPGGPALMTAPTPMSAKPPNQLQQPPPQYHYEQAPPLNQAVSHQGPPPHSQQLSEPHHQANQQQQHISEPPTAANSTNPNTGTTNIANNLANIKEKTPMCLVNELARYNKIQHQYRLTGEQGPAHKKIFTVTLKLGKEEYEAEGPSIKKAQHSAAAKALTKTEFKHPPPKSNTINRPNTRSTNHGALTPTVELNALAMKRGERAMYMVDGGAPQAHQVYYPYHRYTHQNHNNPQGQPRYGSYDQRRGNIRGGAHGYGYDTRYFGQFRPGAPHHNPGDAYTIRLRVGDREYPGHGITVQAARHDAASKAVEHIKQLGGGDDDAAATHSATPENGQAEQLSPNSSNDNSELKSPISLVYELALKRNLNVTFEVLSEKGPPHMKVFMTQCRVGQFVAEGEGNGKKISKKRAAENMLAQLNKLPPLPPSVNTNIAQMKRKRVTTKKKTRNLIKVNVDKTTETQEEINPISRLIQIQQAKKEREPVYTVLEERGAPRKREFVIEASINGITGAGIGPNKKVAKRNAAEALLQQLGYPATGSTTSKGNTATNQQNSQKEKENDHGPAQNEKGRKITYIEEKDATPSPNVGGSGGRQLVPGVLMVTDQSAGFTKPKSDSIEKSSVQTQPIKNPPSGVRSKDQLLYLATLMDIQVHFSDFPKANHEMYLTLVSLGTNPPQVCHGEGSTIEASHEKAALEALKVLSELGLDIAPSQTDNGGDK